MHVIQPQAGRMKHDCLIVNDTVQFVYDQVARGVGLEELVATYAEHARVSRREATAAVTNGDRPAVSASDPHSEEERIRFDLYRTLLALRDRDICEYPFDDLVSLLPPGRPIKGTTQVMPVCLLHRTAAVILESLDHASRQLNEQGGPHFEVFYSFMVAARLNRLYFDPEQILRRHLDQNEVYFVAVDAAGEIEAVTAVQGLPQQPATLRVFFAGARCDTTEAFEERMGIHLARLSGLLQVTALSAKLRFQWNSAADPAETRHEAFDRVIAELGFRRSFVLHDEFADGDALVAFDRTLF